MFKELEFYKEHTPSRSYLAVLINPCFYALMLYRLSHKLYNNRIPLIPKIIWFINRILFNIDIDYRCKIGKNLYIVHGLGIVIGCNVIIGENCKIYQGVTLGGNNNKSKIHKDIIIDQPYIYDNVTIYSNSMIIGPVVIGENSIVGCMSFVDKDIPPNSITYNQQEMRVRKRI